MNCCYDHNNRQVTNAVEPIKSMVTQKKGLKCFDIKNNTNKAVKIVKEMCVTSVKLNSKDSTCWSCCKCLPKSSARLVDENILNAGLVDVLELPLIYNKYPWTRPFSDARFVWSRSFNRRYQSFTSDILCHSRITNAIQSQMEDDGVETNEISSELRLKPYQVKVQNTLKRMSACVSRSLIRLTGWFLFKMFRSLLSSIIVHKGQIHVIQRTCGSEHPVVFLPVHRSHLDYMLLSFLLFNFEARAPYVAAGDNLILPFFGMLMRGLGGFFIRRKMEEKKDKRDFIYRAVLHAYVEQILVRGESLEFFMEGGRSRSGKILTPKTGLLSVVMDTYLQGAVSDVSIVPVAISYEKLPEVNFTGEQLGFAKKSETFWSTVLQSLKFLFGFCGSVRIDFAQPFSLKEFVETQQSRPCREMGIMRSNSDCLITSDEGDNRALVFALANHVARDQTRVHSVSCTHLVAWVLLHVHREGASIQEIVKTFELLRSEVTSKGHGLGFTGLSEDAVRYAICLLGQHLIEVKKDEKGDEFVKPVTKLPGVVELSYYANTINMVFAIDSVLANSIYSLCNIKDFNLTSSSEEVIEFNLDDAVDQSVQLLRILKHEFAFSPVCENLETTARAALYSLCERKIICRPEEIEAEDVAYQFWRRRDHHDDHHDHHHDDQETPEMFGITSQNIGALMHLRSAISPILEAYHIVACHLHKLLAKDAFESEFIGEIHSHLKQRAYNGQAEFEESACLDTLKNCLSSLQDLQIISSYSSCNLKMIGLIGDYQSPEVLNQFVAHLAMYRG